MIFIFFVNFILFHAFSFIHCSSLRALRPTIRDSLFTLTIEISFAYWWIIDALLLSSKCLITRLHFLVVSEIAFKITSTVQVTEIIREVLHFSFISKCWSSILERHLDVCSSSIDVQTLHALTQTLFLGIVSIDDGFGHLVTSFVS